MLWLWNCVKVGRFKHKLGCELVLKACLLSGWFEIRLSVMLNLDFGCEIRLATSRNKLIVWTSFKKELRKVATILVSICTAAIIVTLRSICFSWKVVCYSNIVRYGKSSSNQALKSVYDFQGSLPYASDLLMTLKEVCLIDLTLRIKLPVTWSGRSRYR